MVADSENNEKWLLAFFSGLSNLKLTESGT